MKCAEQCHKIIIFLLLPLLFATCTTSQYRITVAPQGMQQGDTLCMSYYYGQALNLLKKTTIDANGQAHFNGRPLLREGMYSIGTSKDNSMIDFLISANQPQQFSISYNNDSVGNKLNVIFENSPENKDFTAYRQFINEQHLRLQIINDIIDDSTVRDEKVNEVNQHINEKNKGLLQKYTSGMLPLYIHLHTPIANSSTAHYWDNIDFADERIARMPTLEDVIFDYFFRYINPQDTSALKQHSGKLLEKAAVNNKVYSFVGTFLYDLFITSPIPNHDKVAAYIANNYILSGYTSAFDKHFITKVKSEITWTSRNPLGSLAPDLKLRRVEGDYVSLSNIKAKFTVLFFFDPDCSSCRETAPLLYKLYKVYKPKGLEIYAIYPGTDESLWKSYVIKQKYDWINVWTEGNSNLIYDNYSLLGIPSLYLLDENKHIIAKDLDFDQLQELVEKLAD